LAENGGTAGVKTYNAGMRGGKTSVHEGGSRVPLFMRWPAAQWAPHVVNEITSHIDLFPTIMDLCDVEISSIKLDGMSLKPLLVQSGSWPARTLFTHNPIDETNKYPGAVRTQRHRLVREIKGSAGGSKAKADDAGASPWQLYDMEADPSEQKDLAEEQPEIVAKLSAAYDAWFADISRAGLKRFPIPVGHAEHNPVELHAPQAFYDKPLVFASGPGYANDWLTGWTEKSAQVRFDVDVATSGEYDLELAYAASASTVLRLQVSGQTLEKAVVAAPAPEIPLPHRDTEGKVRYRDRQWATLKLGTVSLRPGPVTFMLECSSTPGIDLKHLKLKCH
jgi:hypothetical protein